MSIAEFTMSSDFEVSEDVKELVAEISAKYNWGPVSEVRYYPGSELGDGYASKHVAVDIVGESDTLKLFAKYALNLKVGQDDQLDMFYRNEGHFYSAIYPTFNKFLRENGLYKGFENVPKCFGTSGKNVIALENVKVKGFTLFDRTKNMNHEHITLVLMTLPRFHAISFAFKDQKRGEFDELVGKCNGDVWGSEDSPQAKMFRGMIQDALDKLDPEKDQVLLERCDVDVLLKSLSNTSRNVGENPVLTKGDCWCNNIMFLYEDDNLDNPIDVMHVDWQVIQFTSIVYDISYFLYTVASSEVLKKFDFYLQTYHSELSRRIKQLGSDPKILYPYSLFEKEWKQYSKFGFAISFFVFKFMLTNKDEIPKFEEFEDENFELFTKFRNEDEYMRRIRTLAEFMVERDFV